MMLFHTFPLSNFHPSDAERSLADAMVGYWTRFAASGDPNGAAAREWPRWDAGGSYLAIDTELAAHDHLLDDTCDFWDGLARDP